VRQRLRYPPLCLDDQTRKILLGRCLGVDPFLRGLASGLLTMDVSKRLDSWDALSGLNRKRPQIAKALTDLREEIESLKEIGDIGRNQNQETEEELNCHSERLEIGSGGLLTWGDKLILEDHRDEVAFVSIVSSVIFILS
jgi:hypothetical protein